MSFNQIRGEQIKNNQITDDHIKTKLSESVLDIDFISHASEILGQKLVVDYVQKQESISVSINSNSATNIKLSAAEATSSTETGVITNTYKVLLRKADTGEPITNSSDLEIYGYLSNYVENSGEHTFSIVFYVDDGTSEIPTNMPDVNGDGSNVSIEIVYPQRFTLDQVGEMFAANTKFVDGAADVTTHLNIDQLVQDVFGANYELNTNGLFSDFLENGNTLIQQLIAETSGVTNPTEKAKEIIDEVVVARGGQSSLNARFTNIEDTIAIDGPLDTRISNLETEIVAGRDTYDSINDRMSAIELSVTNASDAIFNDLADDTDPLKGASLISVYSNSDVMTGLGTSDTSLPSVLNALLGYTDTKIMDEENARASAINALETKYASNEASKGASLIGVHDINNYFVSADKNLENILDELYEKIVNDVTTEETARIDADDALEVKIDSNTTELDNASGTAANLNERITKSLNEDGTLKGFNNFHRHVKMQDEALSDGVDMTFTFTGNDQFTTPQNGDVFNVYVNGIKQFEGLHYTVAINGLDVTVSFTGDSGFFTGDWIQLEAVLYANTQPTA